MKHIVCYGDSNTMGFNGKRMADGFFRDRYDEKTRWTCRLQALLGDSYFVTEEGMGGRTTCFDDPLVPGRNGTTFLDVAVGSHEPVDLFIVMLGTNDLRDVFPTTPVIIGSGMLRLINHLKDLLSHSMNPACRILIVAPPNIRKNKYGSYCYDYSEQSEIIGRSLSGVLKGVAEQTGCAFADAGQWCQMDESDGVHLNEEGHKVFAEKIAEIVRGILES